jgi:hypothetical protein
VNCQTRYVHACLQLQHKMHRLCDVVISLFTCIKSSHEQSVSVDSPSLSRDRSFVLQILRQRRPARPLLQMLAARLTVTTGRSSCVEYRRLGVGQRTAGKLDVLESGTYSARSSKKLSRFFLRFLSAFKGRDPGLFNPEIPGLRRPNPRFLFFRIEKGRDPRPGQLPFQDAHYLMYCVCAGLAVGAKCQYVYTDLIKPRVYTHKLAEFLLWIRSCL